MEWEPKNDTREQLQEKVAGRQWWKRRTKSRKSLRSTSQKSLVAVQNTNRDHLHLLLLSVTYSRMKQKVFIVHFLMCFLLIWDCVCVCVCVYIHVRIHRCVFIWFCAECEWAEVWSISVVVGGGGGGWAVVWFPFPVPFFFFYPVLLLFLYCPFSACWPTLFLSFFFPLQKIIRQDTSFIKRVCVCVCINCVRACMHVCV